MQLKKYAVVPGRGLLTKSAIEYRKKYLSDLGYAIDDMVKTSIDYNDVQRNIESLIGSVEIPTGLIGPLQYNHQSMSEDVFCIGATLEGALIASMNRGAKAISISGGFMAEVIHQKMVRSPLFILSSVENAVHFETWVSHKFDDIKNITENYSNHAVLLELDIHRDENNVHINFIYTTGDAAGQNMTTTCTWHGILWIVDQYAKEGNEKIVNFVLEGNGSSDKKVSQFLIDHGRGIKVQANAILKEEVINKVLRTSSDQLLKFYGPSREYAKKNGMVGYNINVANAIAAIFAATGQDLASIHESSVAELELNNHPDGLVVSLTLFSLVVGTLGGGTHLPKQQQALQLMGCAGNDKVRRFASLIAGFAMGLEISTYAAMVSGEFAKAHEKLGRNKPHDWLQWRELDKDFINSFISPALNDTILGLTILKDEVDNGVLMNLSKKVNRKLIGFIPLDITTKERTIHLLLKSKGTDLETIKGLHLMAASIDPLLSDLITQHKEHLEYMGSHIKELTVPAFLHANNIIFIPEYYGHYVNEAREIYILAQERLLPDEMAFMDSENSPKLWVSEHIENAITAIHEIHQKFIDPLAKNKPVGLLEFDITKSIPLYHKLATIVEAEDDSGKFAILHDFLNDLSKEKVPFPVPKTLVHNDYNPRNVAVRKNGDICIYDWELAVLNYPHRDIIEFLSFTLPQGFEQQELFRYLHYHHELTGGDDNVDWKTWKKIYILTLKEYLLSRVSFYCAAQVVMKLKFADRIFDNGVKMIKMLEE